MSKTRNAPRNSTIFMDYHGINESQERVPAVVLASRYGLTRARVYQILNKEKAKRELANPRLVFQSKSTEEDAQLVAKILSDFLVESR